MSLNGMRFGGGYRSPLTVKDKVILWAGVLCIVTGLGGLWLIFS